MWPTMTGIDEYTLNSSWYRGGRDIQVGDIVLVRNPAKKKDTEKGAWLHKRVVGLAGYTTSRHLHGLGHQWLTVRDTIPHEVDVGDS